jgi:hypothetical protein
VKWLTETESIVKEFGIEPLVLGGYNTQGFDIPFLEARGKANGVSIPNGFQQIDLMLILFPKGWPNCESFDKAALRYGIVRKNPIRGSDIPRLWAEGKIEDIKAHNLDDVEAEYLLFQKLKDARVLGNGTKDP